MGTVGGVVSIWDSTRRNGIIGVEALVYRKLVISVIIYFSILVKFLEPNDLGNNVFMAAYVIVICNVGRPPSSREPNVLDSLWCFSTASLFDY